MLKEVRESVNVFTNEFNLEDFERNRQFMGENLFQQLVERMLEGLLVVNNDDVIQYVNPMFCQLLGYHKSELLGKKGYEILLKPQDRDTISKKNLQRQSGISDDYIIPMLRKDGEELIFRLKASPLISDENVVIGSMAICLDITEKIKAEAKIDKLLQQKEMLLREVHHRIKNNMGTIRGLLALQAYSIEDEPAVEALNDAQNRVMSMMVIYDKLYRSHDFQSIDVKDYLGDLVDAITETFSGITEVSLSTDYGICLLDSDSMFNIGIIVSELLTNALKYAFPDGQKGHIYISCQQLENGSRELIFEDDGIGIRNFTTTQSNGSFGMELVKMLVEQLNGKIKLTTEKGTRYQIVF